MFFIVVVLVVAAVAVVVVFVAVRAVDVVVVAVVALFVDRYCSSRSCSYCCFLLRWKRAQRTSERSELSARSDYSSRKR